MSIWIKLKVNNNTIYLPFTKRITSLIINPVTGSIKFSSELRNKFSNNSAAKFKD
jgi:hypothetical protein